MPTINIGTDAVTLTISADESRQWARDPSAAWPCSTLKGREIRATFDSNGLLDLTILEDGQEVDTSETGQDIDGNELSAITSDHLNETLPTDHPAWCVAVGQFGYCEACGKRRDRDPDFCGSCLSLMEAKHARS